jgi:hypothetical protein
MFALAGCGSGVADLPQPSATASVHPSATPTALATPIGFLRIPLAGREMELAIVGSPDVLTAWRAATDQELSAVAWGEGQDVVLRSRSRRELVLGWIGTACDTRATLTVEPRRLVVRPAPREACDAMAQGRGVVLTFAVPADPASIAVVLENAVLLPGPT